MKRHTDAISAPPRPNSIRGRHGRRGESSGVDFRTLGRVAEPRTKSRPYWESPDQNP
jgi:hypothetical protein